MADAGIPRPGSKRTKVSQPEPVPQGQEQVETAVEPSPADEKDSQPMDEETEPAVVEPGEPSRGGEVKPETQATPVAVSIGPVDKGPEVFRFSRRHTRRR